MPLNITTSVQEIDNRSKIDVQAELQNSNPFIANSWLASLIVANSGRFSEIYKQVQNLTQEMFPDTADGVFLQRWGAYRNVNLNAATQSLGTTTAQGAIDLIIPINTNFTYSNGLQFFSTAQVAIVLNSNVITSLSRSANTVFAITASDHNYSSGIIVTISGASNAAYNVTIPIIVTGRDTFTYPIATEPPTPATGSILASANTASVPVKSTGFGKQNNLESGSLLVLSSSIPGINSNTYVQFDGVTGGADIEIDPNYKKRVLYSYRNPNTPFNVAEITRLAKTISGVTRVFVEPITPDLGQVTVYFTRDNDANIIPSGQDVINVKNTLLTIMPVNMAQSNLIVNAPDARIVDFVFSEIVPDTDTMRAAIDANLDQAFKEQTSVDVNVASQLYNSAIYDTIDPDTGDRLQSFNLIGPTGDIIVDPGQIAVLGTISHI